MLKAITGDHCIEVFHRTWHAIWAVHNDIYILASLDIATDIFPSRLHKLSIRRLLAPLHISTTNVENAKILARQELVNRFLHHFKRFPMHYILPFILPRTILPSAPRR